MSSQDRFGLVIAGGGTGGHFFCGVAIAEEYLAKHPSEKVLFIGVRKGIEGRIRLPDSRMQIKYIEASGFMGLGLFQKIKSVLSILGSLVVCMWWLLRFRPRTVVGVGGYISISTVLAASFLKPLLGLKIIVVEQNSVPGLANRLMSRLPVLALSPFRYAGFKMATLPVRQKIKDRALKKREAVWPPKTILILGGSQGAKGLNQAWQKMIRPLKEEFPEIKILHQTGAAQESSFYSIYQDLGISAEVFAFSQEMERMYDEADLVISRAGALAIFEIIAFARPAILIPFPHATDDHQFKNAQEVQHYDWVFPEGGFNWPSLQAILRAPRASIPRVSVEDPPTIVSFIR